MKIFLVKSDLFKFLLKSRCWEPLRVSTLKEFSRNYSFLQHKKKKRKNKSKKIILEASKQRLQYLDRLPEFLHANLYLHPFDRIDRIDRHR